MSRQEAIDTYIQALSTGAVSAARRLRGLLADEVVAIRGTEQATGPDAVVERLIGSWPQTAVLQRAGWSTPKESDGQAVVRGEIPPLSADLHEVIVTFDFDAQDRLTRVVEEFVNSPQGESSGELPLIVRGLVSNALANNTPLAVAYVGDDGLPHLSLRGSVQFYGETQLCMWVRKANDGLAMAMDRHPDLALMYRDSSDRTTLIIKGKGRVDPDVAVRTRVFNLSPEVEQNHDPGGKNGAAVIIEIESVVGRTAVGRVSFRAPQIVH